jgi:SNF2 family DNA or RNA helicase
VDALLEDLDSIKEPIVVFAVSRQLIDLASIELEKKGIAHTVIKGGQSADQRQNAIDQFQNGRVDVVLVVIAAGGTGVNLNRARVGIWMERPFSNVEHHQSIGRIHRIGSEVFDSVVIIDYITPDTIEERVIEILETKKEQLEDVVRDAKAIRKLLDGKDRDDEAKD